MKKLKNDSWEDILDTGKHISIHWNYITITNKVPYDGKKRLVAFQNKEGKLDSKFIFCNKTEIDNSIYAWSDLPELPVRFICAKTRPDGINTAVTIMESPEYGKNE